MTEPTLSENPLENLAARVEAATGPDRELDCAVAVAVDYRNPDWEEGDYTARSMAEKHGLEWLVSRAETYTSSWRNLPQFTASPDAAMSLADGLARFGGVPGMLREAMDRMTLQPGLLSLMEPAVYAQMLARFMTAACLRARAAMASGR